MKELTNVTEEKTFTQEEVNEIIGKRLEKAEKKWTEKYSNYYSADDLASKTEELNKQITDLGNSLDEANNKATASADSLAEKDQAIADLENRVRNYETDSAKIRIALEVGIPYELANRLTGATEEEIRADAEKMLPLVAPKISMPLRNPDANVETDGVLAEFRKLNPNIKI